jgi:hypothetical protein
MAYGVNAPFGLRPISSITGGSWTEKVNEYYIYTDPNGTNSYNVSIFTGDPVVFTPTAANITGNPSVGGFITRYLPAFADAAPATFSTLPLLGVFVGCEYTSVVNGTNSLIKSAFWPAGTAVVPGTLIKAFVIDDPNVVYDVQISSSIDAVGNAFIGSPTFPNQNTNGNRKGAFGSNFALNIAGGTNFSTVINAYTTATGNTYANNPASGSTLTGQSAFYLDVATPVGGDATHDYLKTTATLPLKVVGWTQNPNNVAATGLTQATTPFLNVRVIINNHVYGHSVVGTTLA